MIPFNFAYLRPKTIDEAVAAFEGCAAEGLEPYYYGGGTEIVTFARDSRVKPGAVIDIKGIPECIERRTDGESLVFGAGIPLNKLDAAELFPLLDRVASGVADHSVRNRLTLGGNVAGRLPYRETVLPLLVCGAVAQLAGPEGGRTVPIDELFEKRLRLETGELVVQFRVPRSTAGARWHHVRREKGTRTDYPIVSISFAIIKKRLRMAASGVCAFPFRSDSIDETINDRKSSAESRAEKLLDQLPGEVRSDQRASAEYRRHLFITAVVESIATLERKG